jgi:exopolysaccharide biosynthesis polyprenyl glycosylphosphotransferase
MRNREHTFEKFQFRLRLASDFLSTVIAWFSSYYLRFYILPGGKRDSLALFTGLSILAIFSTGFFLFYHKLYESNVVSRWGREVGSLMRVSLDVFLVFVVIYYYLFAIKVSRVALVLFAASLFLFLFIGRRICNAIIGKRVRSGKFSQRTLVVGYGKKVRDFCASTAEKGDASRFRIVGQYLGKEQVGGLRQIQAGSLEEAVKENEIDIVVMGFPPEEGQDKIRATKQGIELLNAKVFLLPDIPRSYAGAMITSLYSIPAVQVNSSELSLGKRFVKRTFDIFSCSLAVILLSPVFLILALLVKITSRGPVFFRQDRITRGGKVFKMLKFRSMRIDMPEQNGPHWTEEDDPRITKLGKFIRKTSLDELPQFFNVIGGSMSLIGPRPERPELVEQFKQTIPGYDLRHRVKAGISGWAQVNGLRGNTSIEKRVAFDLYYIRHWSVFFDFKVVILTFLKGFINKNAY